jgi:hypothetical protein
MLGDLNVRVGKNKTMKTIGRNGKPTINNNGRKLTDFCAYQDTRIMNSFFKHKDIHKYTWCTQGTKSIIDYAIANEMTAELNMDHFLLCMKLQFPPRWKNSKNCNKFNRRNDHPPQTKYKTRLLNDASIKWLYRRRIEGHLKNTIEDTCGDRMEQHTKHNK